MAFLQADPLRHRRRNASRCRKAKDQHRKNDAAQYMIFIFVMEPAGIKSLKAPEQIMPPVVRFIFFKEVILMSKYFGSNMVWNFKKWKIAHASAESGIRSTILSDASWRQAERAVFFMQSSFSQWR